MGILDRIWNKIRHSENAEAGKEQPNSIASAPLPPPQPHQTEARPAEGPEGDFQKESFAPKTRTEPEAQGVKLPAEKHILREIEDPFSKKDKSRIFQENLDLIALFKRGEFSEKEALHRQRSAIMARLERKHIDPETAKGLLDDYGYYFMKELEEAMKNRKARRLPKESSGGCGKLKR